MGSKKVPFPSKKGFHVHLFRLLIQFSYLFHPKQIPCFLFVAPCLLLILKDDFIPSVALGFLTVHKFVHHSNLMLVSFLES